MIHTAPPVRYPVKPSRLRRGCEGGVFVVALICMALWAYETAPSMLRGVGALCLCLPALAFIVQSFSASSAGELAWDGSTWALYLHASGEPVWAADGRLDVLLDFQFALLLRWRTVGVWGAKWTWLERRSEPSRWHLLRCAVYSRAAREPSKPSIGR